jgi:hypothetical protein
LFVILGGGLAFFFSNRSAEKVSLKEGSDSQILSVSGKPDIYAKDPPSPKGHRRPKTKVTRRDQHPERHAEEEVTDVSPSRNATNLNDHSHLQVLGKPNPPAASTKDGHSQVLRSTAPPTAPPVAPPSGVIILKSDPDASKLSDAEARLNTVETDLKERGQLKNLEELGAGLQYEVQALIDLPPEKRTHITVASLMKRVDAFLAKAKAKTATSARSASGKS